MRGGFWEGELPMTDPVHKVQRDPMELLTVEHDKVIFEDQERVVCNENKALLFIIPVIHPERTENEYVRLTVGMVGRDDTKRVTHDLFDPVKSSL